jgi:hypothetical protein
MPPTPDDRPPPASGLRDQLRHDLKSALTTIHARAQLLGRAVRRAPSLTDGERERMLAGVDEIEAAVREMVARIDAMAHEPSGSTDDGADPPP